MPCDYRDYPKNWKRHIVPTIRERSGDRCEWCGVENYARGVRDTDGTFIPIDPESESPEGVVDPSAIRIVLTVAHLDHDLANNDGIDAGGPALPLGEANLVHLCQRCHNRHDREHRAATRAESKRDPNQMSLISPNESPV